MNTCFAVSEASALPDGTLMVRGTVVEGPRLIVGQRGEAELPHGCIKAEVIGVGVVDRNLDVTGRQGLLLRIWEGDPRCLKGLILQFASEITPPATDSSSQSPRG